MGAPDCVIHADLGLLQVEVEPLLLFLQGLASKLPCTLIKGFPVALNIKPTPCQQPCKPVCYGASLSKGPYLNKSNTAEDKKSWNDKHSTVQCIIDL